MRQPLSTTGGYYADPNRHWSAQDCVNWLPMKAERAGTRTPDQGRQCPGLRPFAPNLSGAVRGLHNVEGKLFGVGGSTLYRIKPDVVIDYGTVPGTARVSMAHNAANELVTVNGSAGYLFNTASLDFNKITDEGYPGASVVGFVDQYFPQVAPNGAYWFWSDLSDGASYNTLDRAVAEADPDRIVTLYVSHREVLVFGRDTIEPFVNTGAATGTFQRAANTVIECGCAARFSVAGMDNAVFFLDDKRVVRVLRGVTPERVSTSGIEQALSECSAEEIARAFAFAWEDRGHKVYYLTVPGRFTFGFDLLSGEWHRRLSPGMNTWRITSLVFWEGLWVGGDADGNLYALDWDYHYDGREELIRERITGTLHADQNPVTVNSVELLFGVGGPASELDDWPAQPEGPTITGTPTGGWIGVAYSFAFTVGDGTAPRTVTLREGMLPAGLTLSAAGVISGTPTVTVADTPLTVRVTDANGLWADHDTTLTIVAVYDYLALLHFDGDILDEVGNVWSGPGAAVSDESKFGGGSLRVNMDDDYVQTGEQFQTTIGSGDFSMDAWIYRDSASEEVTTDIILGHWHNESQRSFGWIVNRDDDLLRASFSSDGTTVTTIVSAGTVALDAWVHIRLVREDGDIYQFINGVLDGTGTFADAMHDNVAQGEEWIIGGHSSSIGSSTAGLFGWIDDLAIFGESLGTTNFTPPTAPWPDPPP